MSEQQPSPTARGWLEVLADVPELGGVSATPAERALLLDLARVAAHRSERTAAPITTYLAGLACAALDPADRVARLRAILAGVEQIA